MNLKTEKILTNNRQLYQWTIMSVVSRQIQVPQTQNIILKIFSTPQDNKVPDKLYPPLIEQGQQKCPNPILLNGNKIVTIIIDNKKHEGQVTIDAREFSGYSPFNIPFVACIIGRVAELYVDGKKVTEFKGEAGEVFFRRKISLENGYNRIPIKAIGKSGNATEGYVEVTINETPDKIEIKTE